MGKHAAPDGAAPHPLVSEALAHRTDSPGGAHSEGGLGWPAPPPPDDGGLGWPGDLSTGESQAGESQAGGSKAGVAAGSPTGVAARRGWRRFFGLRHVA